MYGPLPPSPLLPLLSPLGAGLLGDGEVAPEEAVDEEEPSPAELLLLLLPLVWPDMRAALGSREMSPRGLLITITNHVSGSGL